MRHVEATGGGFCNSVNAHPSIFACLHDLYSVSSAGRISSSYAGTLKRLLPSCNVVCGGLWTAGRCHLVTDSEDLIDNTCSYGSCKLRTYVCKSYGHTAYQVLCSVSSADSSVPVAALSSTCITLICECRAHHMAYSLPTYRQLIGRYYGQQYHLSIAVHQFVSFDAHST